MPFDTTILQAKIDKIKETYENGRFGDVLVTVLNTGNGLMQQRIFTQTEDTEGQAFGQYIGAKRKAKFKFSPNKTQNKRNKAIAGQLLTAYQRKRAAAGRQISHKDLEFSGGLRRAIETQVENEHSAVIEFNNNQAAQIARGQEQQIANIRAGRAGTTKGAGPARIFKLSESERTQVVEQGFELIKEILK